MGDKDEEMDVDTSTSHWGLLNPNDNPNDRYNCFITTASGLLGKDTVKGYAIPANSNYSQYIRGIS
jgi:hypothetical protein